MLPSHQLLWAYDILGLRARRVRVRVRVRVYDILGPKALRIRVRVRIIIRVYDLQALRRTLKITMKASC